MIHVYRSGGDWHKNGIDYTIKAIAEPEFDDYKKEGWVKTFEELKPAVTAPASKTKRTRKSKA